RVRTRPRLTSHGPHPWLEAWVWPGPRRLPWTFTFTRLSRSTTRGANSGLYLRPPGVVSTGKPRAIQMLSLFQYCGAAPFIRRNGPGPAARFFTSPPPSSGGGKPGFNAGSGRRVVYLNQGGRPDGFGDHNGFSRPVERL